MDYCVSLLNVIVTRVGDDVLVSHHRKYALMTYFSFLVGTTIFVDKIVTCMDVVYINFFHIL